MSTQTSTSLSTLPRVNLLPPEIGERRRLQYVQAAVVAGIAVAVAGVGFVYYQARNDVNHAKQQLAHANAQTAELQRQAAKADDGVTAAAARLATDQRVLNQALSTQIDWRAMLSEVGQLPAESWLTQLTVTSTLDPGSLASVKQAPDQIGTVAFQGESLQWNLDPKVKVQWGYLANWLDALKPVADISDAQFSSAKSNYIGDTPVIDFQANGSVSSSMLICNTTPDRCDQ